MAISSEPQAEAASQQGVDDTAYGSRGRGWYVVAAFSVLFILSYLDRSFLSVVASSVGDSLNLSDTQLGLIIGTAFALLYAGIGVPVAHWMDNRDRRLGVILGVVLWSAATAASGFAQGFTSLLICRAGVAVGEAVLTPAVISLIADLFAPRRRTLPMTIYAAVGSIMPMGALVGGAAVLRVAEGIAPTWNTEAWRIALVLLGVSGFVLITIFALTVREPPRIEPARPNAGSVREFVAYLRRHGRFYLPFFLGSGTSTLFAMGMMAWAPTLLVRQHGLAQSEAAALIGTFGVTASVVGTFLWPGLATVIERFAPNRGLIIALATAASVAAFFVVAPISSAVQGVAIGVAGTMGCLAAWGSLPSLVIQRFAPGRVRARLVALHLLCVSGIGYAIGPIAAATLSDFWGGADGLARGLTAVGLVAAPASVACYLFCLRGVGALAQDDPNRA